MRAAAIAQSGGVAALLRSPGPADVTLLELVQAIGEVTEDDREVVATVIHLLMSGRVRLCGPRRLASFLRRCRHRHVVNARLEAPALRRVHVGVLVVTLVADLVRVAVESDHQHVHRAGRAFR